MKVYGAAAALLAAFFLLVLWKKERIAAAKSRQILLCSACIAAAFGSVLLQEWLQNAFEFFLFWPDWLVWILVFALQAAAAVILLAAFNPQALADESKAFGHERNNDRNSANDYEAMPSLSAKASRLLSPLFFWIAADPAPGMLVSGKRSLSAENSRQAEEGFDANEVIENAMELNDTTIDEICTHRSEMITLSLKDDPSVWRQTIMNNRHTYYPVTNESGDDIVGVLDTRDYFRLNGLSKQSILDKTCDRPFFVSENMTADELLKKMKQRKHYFSIILDEYGGVTGIVTLHDIVEELFGDMPEAEDAKRQADIVRLPKGVWRISGEADLEDVSKALHTHLELDEFETFSGYILGSLGYIPEDGTQFETQIGNLKIQIRSIRGHRIRQTLVRMVQQPAFGSSPALEDASQSSAQQEDQAAALEQRRARTRLRIRHRDEGNVK